MLGAWAIRTFTRPTAMSALRAQAFASHCPEKKCEQGRVNFVNFVTLKSWFPHEATASSRVTGRRCRRLAVAATKPTQVAHLRLERTPSEAMDHAAALHIWPPVGQRIFSCALMSAFGRVGSGIDDYDFRRGEVASSG